MADVTINNLSPITPATGLFLPASDNSTTGKVTIGNINSLAPVQTVFGRAGNVTLQSSDVTGALGYTPIQQGGGTGQTSNKLYIGWSSSNLLLQVDATNFGNTWPISVSGNANTASNGIKAWANFDGTTGTQVGSEFRCSIRASYNIDRIVRVGTGDYIVYFANALQDANYAVTGTNGGQSGSYVFNLNGDNPLQTAAAFRCGVAYPGNYYVTTNKITFMVIR